MEGKSKDKLIYIIMISFIILALFVISWLLTITWNWIESFLEIGFIFSFWIVFAALAGAILLLAAYVYFFSKPSLTTSNKLYQHHLDTLYISNEMDDNYFDRETDPY
jgi:hypothetical protein